MTRGVEGGLAGGSTGPPPIQCFSPRTRTGIGDRFGDGSLAGSNPAGGTTDLGGLYRNRKLDEIPLA